MSEHERSFTADGPTSRAFETGGDNTGIEYGVNAQGTQCGVYGESVRSGTDRESTIAGVGVFGKGDHVGVAGSGNHGQIGVLGTHVRGHVGVYGAVMRGGIGVVGLNLQSMPNPAQLVPLPFPGVEGGSGTGVFGGSGSAAGVHGESTSGNGVFGHSEENDGVVGTSSGDRKSGVFGDSTLVEGSASGVTGRCASPDGAGVFGFSDSGGVGVRGFSKTNDAIIGISRGDRKSGVFGANTLLEGAAFGVSGSSASPDGAGVFGFSDQGYGGRFSGGRAPLRLDPADTPGPPTLGNHQRGELFVDSDGDLFVCKDSGAPGNWFRVQLTPA